MNILPRKYQLILGRSADNWMKSGEIDPTTLGITRLHIEGRHSEVETIRYLKNECGISLAMAHVYHALAMIPNKELE